MPPTPNSATQYLLFQVSLIESFFGRDWIVQQIKRKSQHTAIRRITLAHKLSLNHGRVPNDIRVLAIMPELAQTVF